VAGQYTEETGEQPPIEAPVPEPAQVEPTAIP
jgi:hypothetical protein